MLPVLAIPVFCVATWVSALNDPSSGKIIHRVYPPDARLPRTALHDPNSITHTFMQLCGIHFHPDEFRLSHLRLAATVIRRLCVARTRERLRSIITRDRRTLTIEMSREKRVVFTTFLHEVCVFYRALSFFLFFLSLSLSLSGLSSEKILRLAFTIAVCLLRG